MGIFFLNICLKTSFRFIDEYISSKYVYVYVLQNI